MLEECGCVVFVLIVVGCSGWFDCFVLVLIVCFVLLCLVDCNVVGGSVGVGGVVFGFVGLIGIGFGWGVIGFVLVLVGCIVFVFGLVLSGLCDEELIVCV